jgi:hypothetical protein
VDNVEEPATAQVKAETTSSLEAVYMGAPTTFGSFAPQEKTGKNGTFGQRDAHTEEFS